jgi:hypothetical protein
VCANHIQTPKKSQEKNREVIWSPKKAIIIEKKVSNLLILTICLPISIVD